MNKINVLLTLPEGIFYTDVLEFSTADKPFLYDVYRKWRSFCSDLARLESRTANLPEGLSEGAFCVEMNAVRLVSNISGANTSWDCYNLHTNERIQVKGCSVIPDLTSFGPRSEWDKLYFLDFYRQGAWDGTFDIYLINNNDIYSHKVNATQTFAQQQSQGRRPRFPIWSELIVPKNISPIKTGSLK